MKNLAASCEASNQNNSNCTGCLWNCWSAAAVPCLRLYVALPLSVPGCPTVVLPYPCPHTSPPPNGGLPAGAWANTGRAVSLCTVWTIFVGLSGATACRSNCPCFRAVPLSQQTTAERVAISHHAPRTTSSPGSRQTPRRYWAAPTTGSSSTATL